VVTNSLRFLIWLQNIYVNLLGMHVGILKDFFKLLYELITLGGAGRLDDAKQAYQHTYNEYLPLFNEAQGYKSEIERQVRILGLALTQAKTYLEKAEQLIAPIDQEKNGLTFNLRTQALDQVARFNAGFNSAINLGAGSIAGGSLAVGSWRVVMAVGSASTGAAISGLSGAAATNATLAWFGGGALAAGGTGMAGGAAVLGGLFAIPLVFFAAKGSHKKAREFEKAKTELMETIEKLREQAAAFKENLVTVEAKSKMTTTLCNRFIAEVIRDYKVIRPYGIFSQLKQKTLILIRREPYTHEQVQTLEQLTRSVMTFLNTLGVKENPQA